MKRIFLAVALIFLMAGNAVALTVEDRINNAELKLEEMKLGIDPNIDTDTEFVFVEQDHEVVFTIEANDGDIVFTIKGKEVIRIQSDGGFYINGERTTKDIKLYSKLNQWLDYVLETIPEDREE